MPAYLVVAGLPASLPACLPGLPACQLCRLVCLQLVCLLPISLWPGLVGSFSSEQTLVPVRLSFDHNSAQNRFRLSSDHLRHSLSPDLDQIQNHFSSCSAQNWLTISSDQVQRSSGSDLDQVLVHLSSGSYLDHTQLRFRLRSKQVQFRPGSDSAQYKLM